MNRPHATLLLAAAAFFGYTPETTSFVSAAPEDRLPRLPLSLLSYGGPLTLRANPGNQRQRRRDLRRVRSGRNTRNR